VNGECERNVRSEFPVSSNRHSGFQCAKGMSAVNSQCAQVSPFRGTTVRMMMTRNPGTLFTTRSLNIFLFPSDESF